MEQIKEWSDVLVYDRLADWLVTTFRALPGIHTPEFQEILHYYYTPEEAWLAVQMGPEGGTLDELAAKTGMKKDDLRRIIETMKEKVTIYTEPGSDNPTYRPLGLELPGLLEAVGFGDLTTPYKKQFIKLWGKFKPIYVNEGISALGKHSMAWCAVGELPPDAKPEENLFELIKGNDYFAVALCACRLIEQHAEHGNVCDHAMETCLYFGEIARWAVEQGHARQVSLDEALKMLNLCEEKGQVHVGLPNICICNCCKHACVMFSALKLGVDHIFFHNHFYAVVDAETCTSCGICIDRCPVASIQVDDTAVVDLDKCIGCGACATGCDENAIKMVRRSEEEIAKLDSACMEGFVKMMSRTTPDPLLRKVLER